MAPSVGSGHRGGNVRVVLHTDPQKAECDVGGTKAYTCEYRPGNAGRDFTIRPTA